MAAPLLVFTLLLQLCIYTFLFPLLRCLSSVVHRSRSLKHWQGGREAVQGDAHFLTSAERDDLDQMRSLNPLWSESSSASIHNWDTAELVPCPLKYLCWRKTWKLFNIEQYLCFLNELLPKALSINPVTGACFVYIWSANLNKRIPPLSQGQNPHGKELRENLEEFLTATQQRLGVLIPSGTSCRAWSGISWAGRFRVCALSSAVVSGHPRGMAGFRKGSSRAVSGKDKSTDEWYSLISARPHGIVYSKKVTFSFCVE